MAAQTAMRTEILEDLEKLSERRLSEVRDLVHALVTSEAPDAVETLRFAVDDPLGGVRGQGPKPRAVAASPAEALDEIRAFLSEGRITEARRAALEASERFSEHAEIHDAHTVLNGGGSRVGSRGDEPSTAEEFEWLRRPPEWARGKWVALLGREAVAAADTLVELVETIRSLSLPRQPLVHRID